MASAITPPTNGQAKDFILVHTVQLKPMINAQISGRMISSDMSDSSIHFSVLGENLSEEVDDDDENYDNYYYE